MNWTLDGDEVSTSSIFSVTVTESAHYVANFELDTFEIEAKADPEEGLPGIDDNVSGMQVLSSDAVYREIR